MTNWQPLPQPPEEGQSMSESRYEALARLSRPSLEEILVIARRDAERAMQERFEIVGKILFYENLAKKERGLNEDQTP